MHSILHKTLRIIFVTITTAVVVVSMLFGAFMLPPVQRTMRDAVKGSAQDAFGVRIEMSELVYFPFKTLNLNDLVIYGQDGIPMVSASSATVNVGLASLWRNKLILSSVLLDSVNVDIHYVSDSTLNIAVFSKGERDTLAVNPLEVEIGMARCKDGRIRYLGQVISDLDFNIKNIIAGGETTRMDVSSLSLVDESTHSRIAPEYLSKARSGKLKGSFELKGDTLRSSDFSCSYMESSVAIDDLFLLLDSSQYKFNVDLNHLHVNTNTLRVFSVDVPEDLVVNISGKIKGDNHNIKATNIVSDNEQNSTLIANAEINGYDNLKAAVVDINLKKATTTLGDISRIAGCSLDNRYNSSVGLLSAQAKITGPVSDMKINLSVKSNIGSINADGMVEIKSNDDVHFLGRVLSDGVELSSLTNDNVGFVALNTDFEGQIGNAEPSFAHIKGDVPSITLKHYTYHDVTVDAMLGEDSYSGVLNVDDPNGHLTLVGEYVDSKEESQLVLTARVADLYTGKTNLTPHLDGCLNLSLRADFQGSDPDHAQGEMWIDGFSFADSLREAKAVAFSLEVKADDEYNKDIKIKSDHITGSLRGKFSYEDLINELYSQVYNQADALLDEKPSDNIGNVSAELELQYSDADQFLQFLSDDLSFKDKGRISFSVNSTTNDSQFHIEIGDMEYGEFMVKGLRADVSNDDSGMVVALTTEKMRLPSIGVIGFAKINNTLSQNLMNTDFVWDDMEHGMSGGRLSLYTLFSKEDDGLKAYIDIDETPIYLHGKEWTLHKAQIEAGDNHLVVDGFRFDRNDRYITVKGRATESSVDTLNVGMNQIVIEELLRPDPLERYALAGDLSADLKVSSFFDNPIVNSIVKIDRFHVDEDNLEHLDLKTQWSTEKKSIDVDVNIVTQGKPRASGLGSIDMTSKYMDLDFDIDSLSIGFLKYYLKSSISYVKGTTSGKLKLHGPLNEIGLDARLAVNKTDFTVLSTNVDYTFNANDTVILSPDNMIFRSKDGIAPGIQVVDKYGNKGYFGGNITHDMFTKLYTKLFFLVDNMHVLNLTEKENPTYYGTIFAKGRLDITGVTSDINIGIKAQTQPNTIFSILPTAKSDQQNNNYIKFKNNDTGVDEFGKKTENANDINVEKLNSFVTADIDVDITPTAQLRVVLDPRTDNSLSATGSGNLQLVIDKSGRLVILGKYTIADGIYNFSYANVISKRFVINQGGTITWDGEPFNPLIDVMATYKLKASLYDLVQSNVEGQDLTKRVPINCNLFLTERMADPNIRFKIEIPSTMNFNQYALDQYISTEEEMNRQVFSLLLANRFYASQNATGTAGNANGTSYLGTTVSELLSNQLSNWISQNKYNLGVGVNYRPGDEVTQEEYELALSTQVLDNKIILSGNIGYGRNKAESSEGSVIGDFDVEVKLNKKGNLRAKAYTHSNNDVIYETSPTTQGVGISFREDFNSFGELWRKYWNFITRKRKNEVTVETKEQ